MKNNLKYFSTLYILEHIAIRSEEADSLLTMVNKLRDDDKEFRNHLEQALIKALHLPNVISILIHSQNDQIRRATSLEHAQNIQMNMLPDFINNLIGLNVNELQTNKTAKKAIVKSLVVANESFKVPTLKIKIKKKKSVDITKENAKKFYKERIVPTPANDLLFTEVDNKFKCTRCEKLSKEKRDARRHAMEQHINPKRCKCKLCKRNGQRYVTPRPANMVRHLIEFHKTATK